MLKTMDSMIFVVEGRKRVSRELLVELKQSQQKKDADNGIKVSDWWH